MRFFPHPICSICFFLSCLSSYAAPPIAFDLNGKDLSENQLIAVPPHAFALGTVRFGTIPEGVGTDRTGLWMELRPGEGVLLISTIPVEAEGMALVKGAFRATSKDVTVALVALNSPIDGQLGYTNCTGQEIATQSYRTFQLLYDPPANHMQVAVQAVNSPYATLTQRVYVDNLQIEEASEFAGNTAFLEVPGSFDGELANLITNINSVDGTVSPFFESFSDIALKLSIQPNHLAANIGTSVKTALDSFPYTALSQVDIKRSSGEDKGTFALVMTNGNQNVAVFRDAASLPVDGSGDRERVAIGGRFHEENPDMPIYVIAQNGGPGVQSTLTIDDLEVRTRKFDSSISPNLTIPLQNLPDRAKPLEMVHIPAGTFFMGSPASESGRYDVEGPVHQVTLTRGFYMGKYEVTQAQWIAVMGSLPTGDWRPEDAVGDNRPVFFVSWYECNEFAKRLTERGLGKFRLPTEAEWEYACRAGTTTRFFWGDDWEETEIHAYAWYNGNQSVPYQWEVGLKLPNPWGLYDMAGNVQERCADGYGPYSSSPQVDPAPLEGANRAIRGGDAGGEFWKLRSAMRERNYPDTRSGGYGLRLVREE